MARLRASIVVVGDEILAGFVQDTNSGWLAQRLRATGVPLERIATVPDDLAVIAAALAEELGRGRPRVVITSGGIGSTPDDVTIPAVARCLERELVAHPDLDARITRSIERHGSNGVTLDPEHVRSLRKMTLVPSGARLLAGTGGFAPGVALDVDGGLDDPAGATVVVLPGVPSLLRRITVEGVEPLLAGRGRPEHVVEITHRYPESMVTPALERVLRDHPAVHVGSYPGPECLVRLTGPKAEAERAAAVVDGYLAELDAAPGAQALRDSWQRGWGRTSE